MNGSILTIRHMDDSFTEIEFSYDPGDWAYWKRQPYGLVVKSHQPGVWRTFPWQTIKSYENTPPRGE
jgi:hypothetical protein